MIPPFFGRVVVLVVVLVLSFIIFRSQLNDIIKATYLTLPIMYLLVLLGITLYGQPQWIIYGVGALVILSIIFYLYKKKLPWLYYFSTFYVAALGLYIMITGMDI